MQKKKEAFVYEQPSYTFYDTAVYLERTTKKTKQNTIPKSFTSITFSQFHWEHPIQNSLYVLYLSLSPGVTPQLVCWAFGHCGLGEQTDILQLQRFGLFFFFSWWCCRVCVCFVVFPCVLTIPSTSLFIAGNAGLLTPIRVVIATRGASVGEWPGYANRHNDDACRPWTKVKCTWLTFFFQFHRQQMSHQSLRQATCDSAHAGPCANALRGFDGTWMILDWLLIAESVGLRLHPSKVFDWPALTAWSRVLESNRSQRCAYPKWYSRTNTQQSDVRFHLWDFRLGVCFGCVWATCSWYSIVNRAGYNSQCLFDKIYFSSLSCNALKLRQSLPSLAMNFFFTSSIICF